MSGIGDRPAFVILKDGPLEGRKVDMWLGRYVVLPEYQTCDRDWCLATHYITHEYDAAGCWHRSWSALNPPWALPALEEDDDG